MPLITQSQAATALQLLADAAVERNNEISRYEQDDAAETDEDVDSESPTFDRFYEQGGSAAIIEMTNFDPTQFLGIWCGFEKIIMVRYNTGRGRKSVHTGKDVLFMTLCVMKHEGQWDFLAKMFGLKGPSFEKLIMKFIEIISLPVYQHYVEAQAGKRTMDKLYESRRNFCQYPMALYATDVTFQPSFRPSGSMEEGKKYFSGKHKQYGYKVEVSVLPNGLALCCSEHEPGSVSDLTLFQRIQYLHTKQLRKTQGDMDYDDDGPLSDKFERSWGVLVDKGYQGASEFCRVIHPKKKPVHGVRAPSEVKVNRMISSNRIIVEKMFGRLCGLWTVLSKKWKWKESFYASMFKLCFGMTNFHIRWSALREGDGQLYRQIKTR